MKILLLGSSGFIGSHILTYYSNIHTIVDPKKIDILDFNYIFNLIKACEPDVVINCISYGGKEKVNNTNMDDLVKNLVLFSNIVKASKYYKKYINIGSGIELGKNMSVWDNCPVVSSYAISKNIISRFCDNLDKFYTLRLYGCFGPGEPSFRLFSKYKKSIGNIPIEITDKYYDTLFIKDFLKVLDYYLLNNNLIKDIDCVYKNKLKISTQLSILSSILNTKDNFIIKKIDEDYIGNSFELEQLNLNLIGLDDGLRYYK